MHALPTKVDPQFDVKYNKAKHGAYLKKHLKVDHLKPSVAKQVEAMVKKNWCVFNPDGLSLPVLGHKCSIDTGDAEPVHVNANNYGPRESIIMNQHIAVLLKLHHIEPFPGG